ncbi:MAG: DMT family transporter [Actinomycetota bacterium]
MPREESDTETPLAILVAILLVAVLAISSSAVLILWADAPAVSVTFWRTLGGAVILAPAAMRSVRRSRSNGNHPRGDRPTRRQWLIIACSGIALGIHFATWLSSLELTSVAASVTLVATAPIFIALWLLATGRPPGRATWLAIGLAIAGTAVITIGDASDGDAVARTGADAADNPLLGDGLALIGAATMAVYLLLGDRLRATLSTAAYASRTYGFAAVSVLVFALASGTELTGFDTRTWLAIGAMVLGPQLAGHTALNYLLRRLGSVSVSLALLVEPVGAAVLVWLVFAEIPPVTAIVGAPLVLAAVGLQILIRAGGTDRLTDRSEPQNPAGV